MQLKILAQRVIQILGLKAVYQCLYLFFTLIVIKQLNVDDYGTYSYILALIVYFSAIPLLGMPIYLQKNTAQGKELNLQYFKVIALNIVCALTLVFFLLPEIALFSKIGVLTIIFFNCILAIPVPLFDGLGKYTFQYQFLCFSSLWMVFCLFKIFILKQNINLDILIYFWFINSLVSLTLLAFIIAFLTKKRIVLKNDLSQNKLMIFFDLLLLYAVAIPDSFARFYDRFLAHSFLDDNFLGKYSFNLMIVLTIYALFIRPLSSMLITMLSKEMQSKEGCRKTINIYYMYGFTIYLSAFIGYWLFSDTILQWAGFEKYTETFHYFVLCFINALFYFMSLPFTILITLTALPKVRFLYSIMSLSIFNLPLFFILLFKNEMGFFLGFGLAYSLNFLLSLWIKKEIASYFFYHLFQKLTLPIKRLLPS